MSSGMTEVQTNLANIQGNIFGGFNKDHQSFLFLSMPDQASGQAWLDEIIHDVATCEEVIAFNDLLKQIKRRQGREGVVKATWMNVAFTFSGLRVLGVDPADLDMFPDDFRQGPAARAAAVGDVDDSDPTNWIPPLRDADVHAVVLVASDDPNDLEEEVVNRQAEFEARGIQLIYRQNGEARTGVDADGQDQNGHEHFGFDDGVSQPGVRDDRVTPQGLNADVGLPGQDRLWPGEFVLGYPRQTGTADPDGSANTDPGEIAESGPAWTTDGSYLVFRRLRQDVKGFRDFVKSQAAVEQISVPLMGAKLVGRYTSGCPLEIADGQADNFDTLAADPSIADPGILADERINAFDYASGNPLRDDSTGHRVPRAGHIRKVYPRNAKPPGEPAAEARRILRRGIAFGASFDETAPPGDPAAADATFPDDRGLLFLCYQTSISNKFEFLMEKWVDNPNFPEPNDGHDLVISQRDAIRTFDLPDGKVTPFTAPQRWVITSWSGYFFQPSLLSLAKLAGGPQ
jgi:Dyp-type peroxidase family